MATGASQFGFLKALIKEKLIDVACVGIGENGHLAFHDPLADFETRDAYLVMNLDEVCRHQQVGEGGFAQRPRRPQSV